MVIYLNPFTLRMRRMSRYEPSQRTAGLMMQLNMKIGRSPGHILQQAVKAKQTRLRNLGRVFILMVGLFKFCQNIVQIMPLNIYALHIFIPWRLVKDFVEIHAAISNLHHFLYFDIQLSQFVFKNLKFVLDIFHLFWIILIKKYLFTSNTLPKLRGTV